MTVKELKEYLNDMPDNYDVVCRYENEDENAIVFFDIEDVIKNDMVDEILFNLE